jgi:hypothetical protein
VSSATSFFADNNNTTRSALCFPVPSLAALASYIAISEPSD